MWRGVLGVLAVVLAVYGYGHPYFDGYRPTAVDRALQSFHTEVDSAARAGKQALAGLDQSRANQAIRNFIDRIQSEILSKTRPSSS